MPKSYIAKEELMTMQIKATVRNSRKREVNAVQ